MDKSLLMDVPMWSCGMGASMIIIIFSVAGGSVLAP